MFILLISNIENYNIIILRKNLSRNETTNSLRDKREGNPTAVQIPIKEWDRYQKKIMNMKIF